MCHCTHSRLPSLIKFSFFSCITLFSLLSSFFFFFLQKSVPVCSVSCLTIPKSTHISLCFSLPFKTRCSQRLEDDGLYLPLHLFHHAACACQTGKSAPEPFEGRYLSLSVFLLLIMFSSRPQVFARKSGLCCFLFSWECRCGLRKQLDKDDDTDLGSGCVCQCKNVCKNTHSPVWLSGVSQAIACRQRSAFSHVEKTTLSASFTR